MANQIKRSNKYLPYLTRFNVDLKDRSWPNKQLLNPPLWCSVDLRDGNQALINPMSLQKKLRFYDGLLKIGFKEIEIGFPSASAVEYNFARRLIEGGLIPDDVTPQVLTQAREHLVVKTFEALNGAKKAIVHLYNSTSVIQRRIVFRKEKREIIQLAVEGVRLVKNLAKNTDTKIVLEYSPESFTGTELDFAREICESVMEVWSPTAEEKMIINLPATVEMSTPNVYADQIEWFVKNVSARDTYKLSLHTHNDRGSAVAATELGLLAGADRVEGTLLGNGERTGNVDLVTLALNLLSQGVDPGLDFSNLEDVVRMVQECTDIKTHPRHPYAGDLVFTAFSGSHQDAINKGMAVQKSDSLWEVPYIPIDPKDIGRKYDAIVRINSQSGKGGVAYILKYEFGFDLPKIMHPEISDLIQSHCDETGQEVAAKLIYKIFSNRYLATNSQFSLVDCNNGSFKISNLAGSSEILISDINVFDVSEWQKLLNPNSATLVTIAQIQSQLYSSVGVASPVKDYQDQSVVYSQLLLSTGELLFGIGIASSLVEAQVKAILNIVGRLI